MRKANLTPAILAVLMLSAVLFASAPVLAQDHWANSLPDCNRVTAHRQIGRWASLLMSHQRGVAKVWRHTGTRSNTSGGLSDLVQQVR